jgi:5'-nucleotidase
MARRRPLASAALAAFGALSIAFGAMGLGAGSPATPAAEAAAARPFNLDQTDQDLDVNAILLPQDGPVVTEPNQQTGATTTIQVLMYNDFHGNVQPPSGSGGTIVTAAGNVTAGGAEYLSTHLANLKKTNPNTYIVSAGDLFGGSPFLSGLFKEEPTVEVANLIGTQLNVVGNHEFDKGTTELRRMVGGGCVADGCKVNQFKGSTFKYLAANVIETSTGKPLYPAYEILTMDGVKVAFIGVITKTTPSIVTASGVAGLQFRDEAETVNALIPEVEGLGAKAIVLVIHEGANTTDFGTGGYNACTGYSGPLADVLKKLTAGKVDLVLSGHSHFGYNCVVDGRVIVQAASFGRLISKADVTVDKGTGKVTKIAATNQIVTRDVAKDPAITALIDKYVAASAPLANRVVGRVSADLDRVASAAGETKLGNVIADAQLAATSASDKGGAVIAFMNPGGVRADILFKQAKTEGDGVVTYEETFTSQPFGNYLVTLTLTGAQIKTLLDQQWTNNSSRPRILHVSKGFSYRWDGSKPDAQKVDGSSLRLNGVAIDPAKTYRVTVNSFLADGGDNFTVLREGKDRLFGEVDVDALERYLTQNAPVSPPALDRITVQNPPTPTASPTASATTPAATATTPAATATSTATGTPRPPAPLPPATGSGRDARDFMPVALILLGLAALAASGTLAIASRDRR